MSGRLALPSVRPFAATKAATTASADSSLRSLTDRCPFRHKARSPRVRTHPFPTRPPDLRRFPFGHESFTVSCPFALVGSALYPISVRRPMGYLSRFLQTVGRPSALALPFGRCGQLPGGLAPPGVRPCRAHIKKGNRKTDFPNDINRGERIRTSGLLLPKQARCQAAPHPDLFLKVNGPAFSPTPRRTAPCPEITSNENTFRNLPILSPYYGVGRCSCPHFPPLLQSGFEPGVTPEMLHDPGHGVNEPRKRVLGRFENPVVLSGAKDLLSNHPNHQ